MGVAHKTGYAEAATKAGMVDEPAQSRALELSPGDRVDEDPNGGGLTQGGSLGGNLLFSAVDTRG